MKVPALRRGRRYQLEWLEDRRMLAADLLINELQAVNSRTLTDIDRDHPSWIELHNVGDEALNLAGWKLTDDATDPGRWELPAFTIEAGNYLTVFTSGKDRTPRRNFRDIHTNFQLEQDGGFVALVRPDNTIKHSINYPEQWTDQSYGLSSDLEEVYFIVPSPGQANMSPAAPRPTIVQPSGYFQGEQQVSIDIANVEKWNIHYTLDGSEPNQRSPRYDGPFTIGATSFVHARTFPKVNDAGDYHPSNVTAQNYMAIHDGVAAEFSSDLPIIVIDTLGERLTEIWHRPNVERPAASMTAFAPDETGRTSFKTSSVDLHSRIRIGDIGEDTVGNPKPDMLLDITAGDGPLFGEDTATDLLGMPADSTWRLVANMTFDRTLMHDAFGYDLSAQIGKYAPRWQFVEVFLNTSSDAVTTEDYAGVYLLMEEVEIGENRIDITPIGTDDNAEPEITGGYLWRIDRVRQDESTSTAAGQRLLWDTPTNGRTPDGKARATPAQQQYVEQFFDDFATSLATPSLHDPDGYSKYIDVDSWIDHHLLSVMLMNVDALRLNTYFVKDRGGKVELGPLFDLDRSLESVDVRDDNPFKWRAASGDLGVDYFGNRTQRWWGDLFSDPNFWQAYVDRWQELRRGVFSDTNLVTTIDRISNIIDESQGRNFERWRISRPRISSRYLNHQLDGTWQGEVNNMTRWLLDRVDFMDSNFAPPTAAKVDEATLIGASNIALTEGQSFTIVAEDQELANSMVYYTTDGTDPRTADGTPSPSAMMLRPGDFIPVTKNEAILARSFDDGFRGTESRVVLTNWGGLRTYNVSRGENARGDFDANSVIDANDINLLFAQLRSDNPDLGFDLTNDGVVGTPDRDRMVEQILGTSYGDSNLDGVFNSQDLVQVFQAGEYRDGIQGNSTWDSGDWNGDGEFDSADIILAFQRSTYWQR